MGVVNAYQPLPTLLHGGKDFSHLFHVHRERKRTFGDVLHFPYRFCTSIATRQETASLVRLFTRTMLHHFVPYVPGDWKKGGLSSLWNVCHNSLRIWMELGDGGLAYCHLYWVYRRVAVKRHEKTGQLAVQVSFVFDDKALGIVLGSRSSLPSLLSFEHTMLYSRFMLKGTACAQGFICWAHLSFLIVVGMKRRSGWNLMRLQKSAMRT